MSREVDQRVVEMQFNNANFEKNTKKSMDSIDRMMEKLQFKGAEKGFEKLDRAAQDVDFDHMSRSLDLLEEKFSTLNIVGTTALVNITNKVMDAGEKMVKSLSLDQISSGWGKYVEKTGNVQTIMNGTGKSIDQVNSYLSKLMWYSDETSFSFNEMTSAISTAVSTGADLDEVLPMIMGIANATADAGKGGEAFAHSIRNLMQSYSTGYLQLQDWNSLALAGTNSKTMVEALIEAGKALGTLNAEGKTAKGTLVNASTFRDTLSEKWATKAVMERAFGKYSEMTLAVYDAVQSGDYDTASEAIEALSGQYDAVSERAFKAAQQAKSFSEAIDATKDAVSTSWMKVFETIFGNKEEATDTWTELSNRLYDIFVPSIEALNERLKEGLDSGWQQLRDEMGDNADAYEYALQKIALKTGAVTQEQIQDAGSFGKALQEGSVDADLLLRGISESRRELEGLLQLSDEELDARGLDRDAIQNYADGFADLSKKVQTGTLKLGDFSKKIGEVSGREHLTKSLWNLWDAVGKVTGSIKGAFDEIFPPASGERIYTIAERLDDFTGKLIISDTAAEKIKMTFTGVFRVLKVGVNVLKKVGSAAAGGLGLLTDAAKPAGSALLDITAGLGEFTARIIEVLSGSGTLEEKLNAIREACRNLLDPLNGLGTALKNTKLGQKLDELLQKGEQTSGVLGVLYRTGKNAFTRLSALAEGVASGSLTLLGGLGLAIGGAVSKLGTVGELATGILGKQLPTMEELGKMIGEVPERLDANIAAFAAGFSSSMDRITAKSKDAFAPVSGFFTALKEGFDAISGTDIYRFLSLVDVGLLAVAINQVAKAMTSLKKMLETPLTSLLNAMSGSFKELTNALKTWQKNNAAKTLTTMATAVLILSGAMLVMSRIEPERFGYTILATIGLIAALTTAAKLLAPEVKTFGKAMESIQSQVLNAATLWGAAAALIGLGVAVGSITKGLTGLMEVLQQGDFAQNMTALATVIAGLGGMIVLMGKLTATLIVGDKVINHKVLLSAAVELIGLAAAVRILASAVKPLSEINATSLLKAGMAVSGLSVELTLMASALSVVQAVAGPLSAQNGLAIAEMAAGLWVVAQAVGSLANIKFVKLDAAMTSMKTLMLLMSVMATVSRKTHFVSGAAIFAMASSLVVLAGAVEMFTIMGDGAVDGLIKVFAAMTMLTAASSFASGSAGAGVGILAIAAALNVLAGAVAAFGSMDGATLLKGGVSVAAGLTALCAALTYISSLKLDDTLSAISKSMVTFSVALGILSLAVRSFDKVTLTQVGSALLAFGGAIGVICATAAAVGFFAPLAKGLGILAKAFDHIGSGALKLAGAAAIIGVLSMFAGPICEAIINAAPEIQEALITLITVLCETIVACAEPITQALVALGTAAIMTIVGIIANLWEAMEPALGELWGNITNWISEHNPFELKKQNVAKETENVAQIGHSLFEGIIQAFVGAGEKTKLGKDDGVEETGKYLVDGVVKGVEDNTDTATGAMEDLSDDMDGAYRDRSGINSPSKRMAENGRYMVLGLVEGLQDPTALAALRAGVTTLADIIDTQFCNDMQIHSPSLLMKTKALFIPLGAAEGILEGTGLTTDAIATMSAAMQQKLYDMENPLYVAGSYAGESATNGIAAGLQNGLVKLWEGVSSPLKNLVTNGNGSLLGDLFGDWDAIRKKNEDAINESLDKIKGKTGSKSKSSSKGKSAAETLADEYTKKLKANKYLQDALSKETALWDETNADTVSSEELLLKRTETVAKTIELQTERVRIAQEQYDKLRQKAPDDDKTKDAYNTLLSEQTSLEKLKKSRYDDIWDDILSRYENDSKTAKDEYELWAAIYEDTATVTEKANRKMEQLNRQINAQAEIVTAAEKEYTELKAEFGEQAQRTQEAYRKYLEEQKDQQDLINDLEEAQLEQFDNQIARYEKEAKLIQNRQQMLEKLYNDGDLSGREDAYKSAVEQYGANSKQARAANLQGTMSSLLGIGSALSSMASSMKKLTEYQKTYDKLVEQGKADSDAALDAMAEVQSEQYNFVGFAENLADAFDMSDNGKKAMMQLGYTISKNWKPIQNGFNKVWKRVEQSFPETAKQLTGALHLAMSEGAAETASSFVQTLVAAMSGDYATALVAGLNTVLNFMNTEFGRAVLAGMGTIFANVMGWLKTGGVFAGLFGSPKTAAAVAGSAVQIARAGSEAAEAVNGSRGIVAGMEQLSGHGGLLNRTLSFVSKLGGTAKTGILKVVTGVTGKLRALTGGSGLLAGIAGAIGSGGPIGLGIAAFAAGGALVISKWEKVRSWFATFAGWLKEKLSSLWNGAKGLLSGAVGIGKNMLGGLWTGVKKVAGGVWNGVKGFFKGIVKGVKNLLGIHSPSTVFAEIGQYMMLGLSKGITGTAAGVDRSLEDASSGFLDIARDSARRLLEVAESDITLQPVLQPVVDLSDVQAGKAWMEQNWLDETRQFGFDTTRATRLAAQLSQREAVRKEALWQKDQPAEGEQTNADVVNAIGTLGGRIDAVAEAVRRMRLNLDGKKLVGGIIYDVDEQLGHLSSRNRR